MDIALISEHASPLAALGGVDAGGQNVHVAALARSLGQLRHRVSVYTRRDEAGLPAVVDLDHGVPGVRVVHVAAGPPVPIPKDALLPYMPEFGRNLAQRWRREGAPEVVHAHFWMSGVAAAHATRIVPVPRVQTFHALGAVKRRHQGDADTSPHERLQIESALARESFVLATCSDENAELLALGADPARINVVPCGVDLDAFVLDGPTEAPTRPRIVTLTRLVERKGIDVVLRALPMLPGVEYVVAGGPPAQALVDDPEACRLRGLARNLGVADRFELRGAIPHEQVGALLGSADVVACTPWYEPFGIVPLEAMACGRPVVASAVGGMLDTVRDGVTGHLVPPRDPTATARAIDAILSDASTAAAMSAAGRDLVEQRYGWQKVAQDTVGTYRRAISAHEERVRNTNDWLDEHVTELLGATGWIREQGALIERWGTMLGRHLLDGGRVLVAGNGGSAAEAQHFTAELVGRFEQERRPLSALCLSAETSSLTAIGNDHGASQVFSRQVHAHGRAGDLLLLLSTSGRSPNVLAAARAGREVGLRVLAMTGRGPNELTELANESLPVPVTSTSTVQEIHLLLLHAVCASIDAHVLAADAPAAGPDIDDQRPDSTHSDGGHYSDGRGLPTCVPWILPRWDASVPEHHPHTNGHKVGST